MMKRLLLSALLIFGARAYASDTSDTSSNCPKRDSCECAATGRSYLAYRQPFQPASPEYVANFRYEEAHARECGYGGALQLVLFGNKTSDKKDLGRYYLPFCKDEIVVNEELGRTFDQPGDVLATHFSISTAKGTFRSTVKLRPEQSVVGLGFQYRQSFWCNEECGRGFFFNISFPIASVRNKVNFIEDVQDDGGGVAANQPGAVANMTEAFKQEQWLYSKLCCDNKETRIADIQLWLGYEWLQCDPYHLETYVGIIAPTGNKPTARCLMEPIVGNGGHVGITFGGYTGLALWCNEQCGYNLRLEWAGQSQYLFKRQQVRSLDLVNKPWSRYIQMYDSLETAKKAATENNGLSFNPGINLLTLPVDVKPGFSATSLTSLVFETTCWQLEAGYGLYARQQECVELACAWQEGPAIRDRAGSGATRPIRDITGNYFLENAILFITTPNLPVPVTSYNVSLIKQEQIDLVSASTPCGLSQILYASAAYSWATCNYPVFVGIGFSYETPSSTDSNGLPARWGGWIKTGISF